jgi:MFS superfamily sulfate permease-like transporter
VSPPGAVLKRLQLHDNVNFLHKAALATMFEGLPEGTRIELDARRTRRLDADVLEVVGNFRKSAAQRNIDLRLVGFPPSLQ